MKMKRYKEELHQFAMHEEDKEMLKNNLREQSEETKKRKVPYIRIACCLLLLTGVAFLAYPMLMDHDQEKQKVLREEPKTFTQVYQPQQYAVHDPVGTSNDEHMGAFLNQTIDQLHPVTQKLSVTSLPVFRYERYKTLTNDFTRYEDDVYVSLIQEGAKQLGMQATLLAGDHDIVYQMQNDTMIVKVKENGNLLVQSQDTCKEAIRKDPETMLQAAQEYVKQYQKATKIQQPQYRIEQQADRYYVLITEQDQKHPELYDANAYAVFSIEDDYIQVNETMSHLFRPTLSIPASELKEQAGDFKIMSVDAAVQTLLEGGFTSFDTLELPGSSDDIVGWELMYTDETYINYLPYQVPLYRFYVKLSDGSLHALDVVAIEKEALSALDEVTWYQKIK